MITPPDSDSDRSSIPETATVRNSAITCNNIGAALHRGGDPAEALRWYTEGLLAMRSASVNTAAAVEAIQSQLRDTFPDLAARGVIQEEFPTLIPWSERVMDRDFYDDPYQDKALVSSVFPIFLYDDDRDDDEVYGGQDDAILNSCNSFRPNQRDVMVTLIYNTAAACIFVGRLNMGLQLYQKVIHYMETEGTPAEQGQGCTTTGSTRTATRRRESDQIAKVLVTSHFHIAFITFHIGGYQSTVNAQALTQMQDSIEHMREATERSISMLGAVKLTADLCLLRAECLYLAGRLDDCRDLFHAAKTLFACDPTIFERIQQQEEFFYQRCTLGAPVA